MDKLPHAEREHALLSASGADRWLNCPPSARLEEEFPDTKSEYAEEGSLAHAIAELKLRKYFIESMSTKTFNARLNKLKKHRLYQEEMLTYTDVYFDFVKETALSFKGSPYIAIEVKLDFSHIVPEGFGTGDCLIIGNDTLHIIDFKYGKGVPVSADNNQMKLYALGALKKYALLYNISKVFLTIIQPRLNNISTWETDVSSLQAWGESIKPIAQMAFEGKGEFTPGEWCGFCRAKARCRARCDGMTALEAFNFMRPPLISNKEVGEILVRAQMLKSWVTDLEDYALSAILAGEEVPGWKAVEGRSNRIFTDIDKAFEEVKKSGIDEALLYERRPITLTAVEKLLGKKKFDELLAGFIDKPPGKPTLAPYSDSREAITNKTTAAEAFAENLQENGGM